VAGVRCCVLDRWGAQQPRKTCFTERRRKEKKKGTKDQKIRKEYQEKTTTRGCLLSHKRLTRLSRLDEFDSIQASNRQQRARQDATRLEQSKDSKPKHTSKKRVPISTNNQSGISGSNHCTGLGCLPHPATPPLHEQKASDCLLPLPFPQGQPPPNLVIHAAVLRLVVHRTLRAIFRAAHGSSDDRVQLLLHGGHGTDVALAATR
jgi:hypothetical protein